jgi:hypothetical protein
MEPRWPSVEEQLGADQVTRGSALEQLIAENQDFDLLAPEEADDASELPLWLRVYWRKNHPEVEHSTVNPGAGYPDVLYDIYHWMLANHDLPWSTPGEPEGAHSSSAQEAGVVPGNAERTS